MTDNHDTSGTDTPRSAFAGRPGLLWAGIAGLAVPAVIGYLLLTGTAPWSDGPSPTPGTPTPSATATSSGTAAPSPTDSETATTPTTGSPTDSPTAGGETVDPCGALTGTVDATGVPDPTASTAERLMAAALACDSAELVRMATADQTELSFGVVTPEEAFAIPAPSEQNRYRLLSTLLTFAPRVDEEFGFHRWPAEPETDADWQALVDAGIISAQVRDTMREFGEGYIGYRVVIAEDGRWTAFLSGD